MKIFVETLKGIRFEIQVKPDDSVADVKKNIEIVLGATSSYPAAEQRLIHKGKFLKDETTLEANNVSENSTIAVMKRKPASTGMSTAASAILKHQAHATETTEPAWAVPANYESISESNIQWILEMAGGEWERDLVVDALCLADNDIDKAVEYIYFGIPVQSEDPYIMEGTNDQTQEPEAFEYATRERPFDFLRHNPEFEHLLAQVKSNPRQREDILNMLEKQNPPLFQLIDDNKAEFLLLVLDWPREHRDDDVLPYQSNEPNNGGDSGNQVRESEETEVKHPQADQTNKPTNNGGDGGNQVRESKETKVEVPTPEDYELIERLEALGFEKGDAAVAYFACNRNAQVAANHLLDDNHKSRDKHH